MSRMTEELKKILYANGADIVGIGELSEISPDARNNMPYGISIAVAIKPEVIMGIADGPTEAYYEAYQTLNNKLDELVEIGAEYIKNCGYHAIPRTRSAVIVDVDGLNTVLPHKTVATRSGIGWIGKCAVLVTREFGSAIRLSSLLTDAPLLADTPINESSCGPCEACMNACPGQAVKGANWSVSSAREEFFDAGRCKRASREAAKQHINREMSLCGKCIQVCPFTQSYIRRMD